MSIEHFPQQLPDLTLWRYMKLSTFILLLEGKVFFPSVSTLQKKDKSEGDFLFDEPETWLMGKLDSLPEDGSGSLFGWLTKQATKLEEMLKGDSYWGSKFLTDIYIRELAKRRAVWCWFGEQHESHAMWEVYGNAGVAVQTSLAALEKALPADVNFQIAKIAYFSRNPSARSAFNPEHEQNAALLLRPHLAKGEEYEHEKEIRITTACLPDEPGRSIALSGVGSMIKEIVVSPLVPFQEAKAIESMVHGHPVWKGSVPVCKRSSLLGRNAEAEEMKARFEENIHDLWKNGEPDLPPPLNGL